MADRDRREVLLAALGAPLAAVVAGPAMAQGSGLMRGLVPASDFPSVMKVTYLNAAQRHPTLAPAAKALHDYADKTLNTALAFGSNAGPPDFETLGAFARLINADPVEVSFVPGTMAAENALIAALGFPGARGNIVTDALHYDGSTYLYRRLAQMGVEVRQIPQRDGRIPEGELLKAIDGNTKLVALSLVSFANGFQHDLVPICAAAHAKGAVVYADIIQAAGAVPFDVRASGVDVCAAGTHKWLMGDEGIGFIYVRKDLVESGRIKGAAHGWKQYSTGDFMIFPDGPQPPEAGGYQVRPGAVGQFEVGTYPLGPMLAARASLAYVETLGVANIHAHAAPLAARMRASLPRLGYPCLSPEGGAPHITSFKVAEQAATRAKLLKAGVMVRQTQNFMRVSTSVYTTEDDIARLEAALA